MLEVRAEVCALHRHPVCAPLRVQAGSSDGQVLRPLLPQLLLRQLR